MTYKDFVSWCNERACDGYWGIHTAMACVEIMCKVRKAPFWKKKKVWKEWQEIAETIVDLTNKKILGEEND